MTLLDVFSLDLAHSCLCLAYSCLWVGYSFSCEGRLRRTPRGSRWCLVHVSSSRTAGTLHAPDLSFEPWGIVFITGSRLGLRSRSLQPSPRLDSSRFALQERKLLIFLLGREMNEVGHQSRFLLLQSLLLLLLPFLLLLLVLWPIYDVCGLESSLRALPTRLLLHHNPWAAGSAMTVSRK